MGSCGGSGSLSSDKSSNIDKLHSMHLKPLPDITQLAQNNKVSFIKGPGAPGPELEFQMTAVHTTLKCAEVVRASHRQRFTHEKS